MSLEKYSALVACGGDGTVHEVVNGMLAREDRVRVPVGMIPNGSGNMFSCGLGMRDT
jgi:diacylglycerol kinase family enzyme